MNITIDNEQVALAVRAATDGGQYAASVQEEVTVEAKADGTSVTAADKEVERRVTEMLTEETSYPVWGEEANNEPDASSYWVVDPIDGTRNYVDGLPLYATSVALVVDGTLEVGAAAVPALDDVWYAERGNGAYCNDEAVTVSNDTAPEGYTSCAAGRATAAHELCVAVNSGWVRQFTSAVYGLLTVAGGSNDFCVSSSLYPWDVGAGALIIQEAGGRVERLGTGDVSWDGIRDGVLLAWNGNDTLHDAVYEELSDERLAALSSV